MPYVSTNYENNSNAPISVKDESGEWKNPTWVSVPDPPPNEYGECVSYVRFVTLGLPKALEWSKGRPVKGHLDIAKGTVIATFNAAGHYHGHAAIYENQSEKGINVVDQWITAPPKPISRRMLRFGAAGISNNGNNFYVVE